MDAEPPTSFTLARTKGSYTQGPGVPAFDNRRRAFLYRLGGFLNHDGPRAVASNRHATSDHPCSPSPAQYVRGGGPPSKPPKGSGHSGACGFASGLRRSSVRMDGMAKRCDTNGDASIPGGPVPESRDVARASDPVFSNYWHRDCRCRPGLQHSSLCFAHAVDLRYNRTSRSWGSNLIRFRSESFREGARFCSCLFHHAERSFGGPPSHRPRILRRFRAIRRRILMGRFGPRDRRGVEPSRREQHRPCRLRVHRSWVDICSTEIVNPSHHRNYYGVLGNLLIRNLRRGFRRLRPNGVRALFSVDVGTPWIGIPRVVRGKCSPNGCHRPRWIFYRHVDDGPAEHAYRAFICGLDHLSSLAYLVLGPAIDILVVGETSSRWAQIDQRTLTAWNSMHVLQSRVDPRDFRNQMRVWGVLSHGLRAGSGTLRPL